MPTACANASHPLGLARAVGLVAWDRISLAGILGRDRASVGSGNIVMVDNTCYGSRAALVAAGICLASGGIAMGVQTASYSPFASRVRIVLDRLRRETATGKPAT